MASCADGGRAAGRVASVWGRGCEYVCVYIYIYNIYIYIYIYHIISYKHTYISMSCYAMLSSGLWRELRGSQGMGVISSHWFDRVLFSVLYMFKPSC